MKFSRIMCMLLLCLSVKTTIAQEVKELTISGTVVDKVNMPIPSVSVYVKDKPSIGTSTNSDGKFSIKAVYGDKVVFSFISYSPTEHVVIESNNNLKITLAESSTSMDEVVIVGLGNVQRKISSVGAITTVDVKDLQSPAPSIANLLGGRAAGVISRLGSGEPGKNISEFWVRGIGTFGANSSALVLIDGLEGDINTIDPADVESFSILKDASATAVYGVRGANGVILVTTKRGQVDRIQSLRVPIQLYHTLIVYPNICVPTTMHYLLMRQPRSEVRAHCIIKRRWASSATVWITICIRMWTGRMKFSTKPHGAKVTI